MTQPLETPSSTDSSTRTVPLQNVEGALKALWAADQTTRVRVSTGTLVVACPPGRLAEVSAILDRLLESLPCRSVVAVLEPGAVPAEAEATVVRRPHGLRCERVVFRADAGRLAGAVLPLTVPDLPVRLWWALPGAPAGRTFRLVTAPGDAVIVDSLDTGLGPLTGNLEWLDLNWWRLAPWRRSLAAAFDPPARRAMLGAAGAVRLEVAGDRFAGAHLLLGWLGSRLGWGEVTGQSEGGLTVASPGGPVELSWGVASRPDRVPGEVVSVEFDGAGGTLAARAQRDRPYLVFESGLEGVAWRERHPATDPAGLVTQAFSGTVPAGWLAAAERCRAWGLG